MSVRILTGCALAMLPTLDAESVQTCVTSPPYFGLRDYGVAGQIGLERTPDEYVARLVEVFREVRRVLRDDGTLWLNLGDSYAGSWGNQGRKEERGTQRPINGPMLQRLSQGVTHDPSCMLDVDCTCGALAAAIYPDKQTHTGSWVNDHPSLKAKDLIGIPWRVAFALQADGWYLRSDIIWAKPNPMPESVTDRPTKAHEYLFLLSKRPSYYYDAAAIAEETSKPEYVGRVQASWGNKKALGRPMGRPASGNEASNAPYIGAETRNRRTVWTVATQPYSGAHFATFPPALIEPCILAGTRRGDVVLDPFLGAGTTAVVADRLGRDCVGVELNPEYVALAEARIRGDAGLFAEVSA